MRVLIALLVIASVCSPALAAPRKALPLPTPQQRAMCEDDVHRLCQSAFPAFGFPDPGKILACLQANRAQLSAGCASLLVQYGY